MIDLKEIKKALKAAGIDTKALTEDQMRATYSKLPQDDDEDEDEDDDVVGDDFDQMFSNMQAASRAVKVSTGITSELVVSAVAKQLFSTGKAQASAKVLEVTNGENQTFTIDGMFTKEGQKPSEWAKMSNGGEYRRIPCFVRHNGLTSLQDVMETRNVPNRADVKIGAGSIVVAPAVFVPAGTVLLTKVEKGDNAGKYRVTTYAKGAYLMTNPFARSASEQELYMIASTKQLVTVKAEIEL